jgi:hypothetical protein
MINTVDASVKIKQNVYILTFLNSLYYTFPIGMFLTACNFLFESVRNYYFDWMIVVLPTVAVCMIGNFYEMFVVYQQSGLFEKSESTFTTTQVSYSISNANLATS